MSFAVKIHQCEHVINADHVFSRPSCARCRWRKRRHATDTAAEDLRVAHALHLLHGRHLPAAPRARARREHHRGLRDLGGDVAGLSGIESDLTLQTFLEEMEKERWTSCQMRQDNWGPRADILDRFFPILILLLRDVACLAEQRMV